MGKNEKTQQEQKLDEFLADKSGEQEECPQVPSVREFLFGRKK